MNNQEEPHTGAKPTPKQKQEPWNRLVISATNKGGVGKSFCLIQLLQWLKMQYADMPFAAFDPDHANRTLEQYHPDCVTFIDVDNPDQIDRVFKSITEGSRISLVDGLGSQHERTMQSWVDEVSLFEIAPEFRTRITYMLVIEDDRDLILQAQEAYGHIGNEVDWLLIRNQKQGDNYPMWDDSDTRKSMLKHGAVEIIMPRLHPNLATVLRRFVRPVGAQFPELFIMDQQRLLNARRKINAEFDRAAKIILPPDGRAGNKGKNR